MVLDLLPLAGTLILAPGVNSMLLFSSGARFGVWLSLQHIFGSVFSFLVILLAANAGFASFIETHDWARLSLSVFGGLFVIYLGAKLFFAGPLDLTSDQEHSPMSISQSAMLMALNPGAYVLAITAVAIAARSSLSHFAQVGTLIVVFALAGGIATFGWTIAGALIRRALRSPKPGKMLNRVLGGIIILSGVNLLIV